MTFDQARDTAPECLAHPLSLAVVRRDDSSDEPFFQATGAICNLPVLTKAATTSGFLNAAPDPDGLLRRIPVLMQREGHVFPSLALTSVAAISGTRSMSLRVHNIDSTTLYVGTRSVPLDGKSNLLLRFRGPKRTFPYVSAVDVLKEKVGPELFKDRIVLIGTTALGTREVVSTPLDTLFAAVEVHATVADNIIQEDFFRRPEFALTLETQLVVALGLFSALVVRRYGLAWGAAAVVMCLAVLWFGSVRVMSRNGLYFSPLFPTMGLLSAMAAMTVARFASERQRADEAGEAKATSQRLMVQSLLSLTEVRDAETGKHSRRTQEYTRVLARQLSTHPNFRDYLTPERVELLASLAPLHDIGKVGVPDHILHKPAQLTPEELPVLAAYTHSNIIPKTGGNTFSGTAFASMAGKWSQGSNLDDRLRSVGITEPPGLIKNYDTNLAIGSPIKHDRLWFFNNVRTYGSSQDIPGVYANANAFDPAKWTYVKDPNVKARSASDKKIEAVRLTGQVTPEEQGRVLLRLPGELRRVCARQHRRPVPRPRRRLDRDYTRRRHRLSPPTCGPNAKRYTQATWSSPVTSRLLFEAGVSSFSSKWGG